MKEKHDTMWEFPSLKNFISRNKYAWWITGIFLLITYGIKLFNVALSHDTEAIISAPDALYESWIIIGRFGLISLKKLLGTYVFNPYIAVWLLLVAMMANAILWNYLFTWLNGGEKSPLHSLWVFPAVFFTSMLMAEQNGFLLQAYEVGVALLLTALALTAVFKAALDAGGFLWYLLSVACCTIAFSCYQSFVPLFAAGASVCFLIVYDRYVKANRTITTKFCLSLIAKLIAVFFVSFILYEVLNFIVIEVTGVQRNPYLSGQVMWGRLPVKECVKNILRHVFQVMTGEGIFYTAVTPVVYVCLIVYALLRIRKKEQRYIFYLLAAAFSLFSPFALTVLLGNIIVKRSEIVQPFIVGFFIQYLLNMLPVYKAKAWKWTYRTAVAVVAFFTMHQSLCSARLYYTQVTIYEQDCMLANKITDRIDKLGVGEFPVQRVVFIGSREAPRNLSCYERDELELVGYSYFEVSYYTMHGSGVMVNFLNTFGHSYLPPNEEAAAIAEEEQVSMPVWPAEGSVALKNGVIIVKLGEI